METRLYLPPGVTKVITRDRDNFIDLIDETTVLKYPCIPDNTEGLQIEAKLFEAIGSHPRIVACNGLTEHGLILQYAPNGNLKEYIACNPTISLNQRLRWCRQAAEAVDYIHQKNVIHCDISLRNILLDDNLDLLLSDFQAMLKGVDGETLLDGLSRECSKSFAPRPHGDYADRKTDLFALGSAIYFIIMGREIFPELDSLEEDEDDEIVARLENGQFPTDSHACSAIT